MDGEPLDSVEVYLSLEHLNTLGCFISWIMVWNLMIGDHILLDDHILAS